MESSIATSPFPIQKLPSELFDVVIASCDDKTLLSISTVCQSWLSVARAHLFARRTVHISPKRADEFSSLSITPYIRNLSFELEDDGSSPPDDAHWLSDIVLPSFGSGPSAITKLSITCVHREESESFAFPSSVGIIHRCFEQTRSLHLHYVDFLSPLQVAQCASSFPYLQTLSISLKSGLEFNHQPDAFDVSSMAMLKLASGLNKLSIEFPLFGSLDMMEQALLDWVSHQSLPLKRLHVANVRRGLPLAILRELVAQSTSLELLSLDPIPVDLPSGLDLSSLVSLGQLRLGPYNMTPVTVETLADFICNTLRSINRNLAPLVNICLPSSYLHPHGDAWDALDHEISTGNHRLVVFFSANDHCDPLKECLKRSREAGKAHIKLYVPLWGVDHPFMLL